MERAGLVRQTSSARGLDLERVWILRLGEPEPDYPLGGRSPLTSSAGSTPRPAATLSGFALGATLLPCDRVSSWPSCSSDSRGAAALWDDHRTRGCPVESSQDRPVRSSGCPRSPVAPRDRLSRRYASDPSATRLRPGGSAREATVASASSCPLAPTRCNRSHVRALRFPVHRCQVASEYAQAASRRSRSSTTPVSADDARLRTIASTPSGASALT
jgi:hypothetical protein